jgi:glucose-1-phosphate cytidylyltransferase
MKTIILAGGWGTRLGQHTEWIPKPMVQVGNRPLIWHIMKHLAHFGLTEFVVSAGVKAHIIKDFFLNYETYVNDFTKDFSTGSLEVINSHLDIDWRVSVVDTGLNTLKGARIQRVAHLLESEVNMVTYGDGLSDIDVDGLLEFHRSHGKTITISGVNPPARFGEIDEEEGVVRSFSEKPKNSGTLINGGFMVFNRGFLEKLTADEDCDLETGVLPELAAEGEVMVYRHYGHWDCIDHERDLIHLNELWNNSAAFWKVWE